MNDANENGADTPAPSVEHVHVQHYGATLDEAIEVTGDGVILSSTETHDLLVMLMGRVRDLEELLARVRCYAIVDPLGNPIYCAVLLAARMVGIEHDIDEALREKS
jgi:hypothetical protein